MAPEGSDDALAETFRERHGDDWRFVPQWGRWMHWDGSRWARDEASAYLDAIRHVCREQAVRHGHARQAQRIASHKTVVSVERLARTDPRLIVPSAEWDKEPMLINTPRGVVNLVTGGLLMPDPSLLMTRVAGAAPMGECPLWLRFLDRITGGDRTMVAYLQRVAGYCLTGNAEAQVVFFLYGSGANGKSIFIRVLGAILGDYAATAPLETFMASATERHSTELAGLQGARMVSVAETEVGRQWAESRLKSVTGGEKVRARFMRQDYFEYQPSFKLIVAGNHKPGTRSTDEAMRRRIQLVPFAVTIPPGERDPLLFDALCQELGGIMAWALEGCLAWQTEGLAPPASVTKASADYFEEEDTVGEWLASSCDTDPAAVTSSRRLFASWSTFATEHGHPAGTAKALTQELLKRQFAPGRARDGSRAIAGLRLRPKATE